MSEQKLSDDPNQRYHYFMLLREGEKNHWDLFCKQKSSLLTTIGLAILGALVLIIQTDLKVISDINTTLQYSLACFFLAFVAQIFASYLMLCDHRTWADKISDYLSKFDSQKELFESKHSDWLSTMMHMLSLLLFISGALIGIYYIFNCGILFIIVSSITLLLFILACIKEFLYFNK